MYKKLFKSPIFSQARYYTRNMRYWKVNQAVILLYHRIADLSSDSQRLAVTPENFEKQIQYLTRHFTVISLDELLSCLDRKKIPHRSVVVTFDDGYADNFRFALPILKKYNVPASFYVAAGFLDSGRLFWWDQLEMYAQHVNGKSKETGKFDIGLNNSAMCRDLSGTAFYERWHAHLKQSTIENQTELLKNLAVLYPGTDKYKILAVEELVQMAKEPLVEIGAHTLNHPKLSNESLVVQTEEIQGSKKELEQLIRKQVKTFSYPFGSEEDFTLQTEKIVADAGFEAALANFAGYVDKNSKKFRLPRNIVRDWDIPIFSQKIETYFAKPISWIEYFQAKW